MALLLFLSDAASLTEMIGATVRIFRTAELQTCDEKMSDLHAANGAGPRNMCNQSLGFPKDSDPVGKFTTGEDRRRVFYHSSVQIPGLVSGWRPLP